MHHANRLSGHHRAIFDIPINHRAAQCPCPIFLNLKLRSVHVDFAAIKHRRNFHLFFGELFSTLVLQRPHWNDGQARVNLHTCDRITGIGAQECCLKIGVSDAFMRADEARTQLNPCRAHFQIACNRAATGNAARYKNRQLIAKLGQDFLRQNRCRHRADMPAGFTLMASTDSCPVAGMADEERRFYGLQFHPEVTHTRLGAAILERFVLEICGTRADWIMGDYIAEAVQRIRAQVGKEEVILGLSGGVDSSVAAALIHRAIGAQLTCVFVDHGLLRLNEGDMVMDMFVGKLHAKVVRVDAADQFLGHLAGVADPEAKRKIIGREFVEVFKAEAAKLKADQSRHVAWLAQGTIYPDVIESGGANTKKAVTIKSHHNVGGLPEQLGLKLLEPLRELFKDEVRELGVALGLPHAMVYRHPFPGPGLGVRILGEVRREYAELLRRADAIFIDELRAFVDPDSGKNWYELTSQAFAVFLPVRSVGVMGDGRTYDYVVALRAVQTSDFMTADWAELPYALLKRVSGRIINEVRGINRVTYDISSKPPATIEWE